MATDLSPTLNGRSVSTGWEGAAAYGTLHFTSPRVVQQVFPGRPLAGDMRLGIGPDPDVCLREVLTLEKQRFSRSFRECIGEAIAIIKASGMSTFSVLPIRAASEVSLVFVDWHETDLRSSYKQIKVAHPVRAVSRFDNQ